MNYQTTNNCDPKIPILPEEAPLYAEFESLVASIYKGATAGGIAALKSSSDELKRQVYELQRTVAASRDNYVQMFAPAVEGFKRDGQQTLYDLRMQMRQEFLLAFDSQRKMHLEHRNKIQSAFKRMLILFYAQTIILALFIVLFVMLFSPIKERQNADPVQPGKRPALGALLKQSRTGSPLQRKFL